MFKRFLSIVLVALIGAATPAVPAQAPSPTIERGLSVSAPAALPQLAQRLPDTIPPLYMLGGDDKLAPVASYNSATDPFPSAILSHSRGSGAMLFDSTGKLTYAPNNLLLQSNTFSNAAWTKVSATITTGVLDRTGGTSASTLTATGAFANLYAFATTSSSQNVIQSIWIRRRTGTGKIWMKVASSGALFEITGQVTSGWTQVSISGAANASSTPNFLQLDTSGDAVDISEAGVSAVTYETTPRTADQVITTSSAYYGPRIDYDPNTLAVKGLLIEEARTNIAVQSNTFSNASWTKDGASVTQNVSGIDGVANSAWTLTALAGASNHWFYQTIASSGVSAQIVAKAGTASWLAVGFGGGALVDGVYFNLSNGTKGTSAGGGITSNITPLGNGYYLCQVYKPGVSNHVSYEIHTADAQALSWTAAGTETIIVQNAQLEVGSFATSYIPDAAAAVTKAADALAAATYSSNPAILQVRNLSTGARSRKKLTTFSSVSSELNEWIEAFRVYPVGTSSAYLDAHLTVDGPW